MMNKNTDVLVIGAGLSGLMAAAKSAKQGKKVIMVAKGMGALGLSSGCIDLWGYHLDNPQKICKDPIAEISRLISTNNQHPYAKVQDVLEESIEFFQELCNDNNFPYLINNGGNWILPTALGTVRPSYLAPNSMAVKDLPNVSNLLIVGFEQLKDFYPEVLATNLKKSGMLRTDCEVRTMLISAGGEDLSPNTLAHRLECSEVINKIINSIKPALQSETVILFPPVLGEQWGSQVLNHLTKGLGCQVYEVTNIPPALPGQRLQQMLLHYIKTMDVEVIMGCTVTSAEVSDSECTKVFASGAGTELNICAKTIILATGSFLGGGLKSKPGAVWESIFDLPIETVQTKWSDGDFLAVTGQPFNKFGVKVNQFLQPINSQGVILLKNVMVTGSNLAGCNFAIEKCGNGVALVTGYKAGKLAGGVIHG